MTTLYGDINTPVSTPTKVYTWDMTGIPNGQITLRLYMQGDGNTYADKNIHLNLKSSYPHADPNRDTHTNTVYHAFSNRISNRDANPIWDADSIRDTLPSPIPTDTP